MKNPSEYVCRNCSFDPFCWNKETTQARHILKQTRQLKSQSLLYRKNDPFQSFYVVRSGILKAYDIGIEGRERITHFYFPGEVIGFESIQKMTVSFSVEALKETVLCEIPLDTVLNLTTQISLQRTLLQLASQRMNRGSYLTLFYAEQRLAGFFIDLAERQNSQTLILLMSRQAIGNYLGLAGETVIRIMKQFEQKNLILADKKKIHLRDTPKLQWIIQGGL